MQFIKNRQYVDNMTFKEIAKQNREKGLTFFHTKEGFGYKKEISPDWACCFVMSDLKGKFHVFQFNPFTCEIVEHKNNLPDKESSKRWLDSNRDRLRLVRL